MFKENQPISQLRLRRHVLGMSQKKLADKSGVGCPIISMIETGDIVVPSKQIQENLASALLTTPGEIFPAVAYKIEEVKNDN